MFQRDSWRLWAMAGVLASGAAAGDIPFRPTRVFTGTPLGGGGLSSSIRPSAVADLDNDGDFDIVGAERNFHRIFWLENIGSQDGRTAFVHHLISDAFEFPGLVHALDIDEDGDIDVIAPSDIEGLPLTAWINDGASFPVFHETPLFQPQGNMTYAASGDLDGDGDLDLVTVHQYGDKLRWHEKLDSGPLDFAHRTVAEVRPGAGDFLQQVIMTDLDEDGRMDLVTALSNLQGRHLLWHRRTEDPGVVFAEIPLVNASWGSRAVIALDLNLDGALDLVHCSGTDDRIVALLSENGKPADFSPLVLSRDPDAPFKGLNGIVDFPEALLAADLDLDGDDDFVALGLFDSQVAWFERSNTGGQLALTHRIIDVDPDGPFGPLLGFSNSPIGGVAADIDGDGDIDLIVTSLRDESITVWENRLLCREDIDGSGLIDFGDVNAVVGAFNTTHGEPGFDADADLDGDGAVGFADLNVLLSYFNSICGEVR